MTRIKSSDSAGPPGRPRVIAAFSVHVFTACGAACALLALIAAVGAAWPQMFAWLGIALVIDAVDGTLARRLEVAQVLPRWSGDLLDFVVDFATYVFVPAYAIVAGVPAATIRMRFSEMIIERLLRLKWWELELSELSGLPFRDIERCLDWIEEIRARRER